MAATKPFTPRILKPVCKMQPHNVTAYLVESHTPNCFHFVWLTPDNRYRCDCTASKYGRSECSHKQALKAKLEAAPHGLREAAFVEQQQEAERLAQLPRTLANVETSEAEKVDALELLDRETPDDEWEEVPAEEIAEIERRVEAKRRETQAEIDREAAKRRREESVLATSPAFSLYRS